MSYKCWASRSAGAGPDAERNTPDSCVYGTRAGAEHTRALGGHPDSGPVRFSGPKLHQCTSQSQSHRVATRRNSIALL